MPPHINLFNFECAPYRSYLMAVKLKSGTYPDALVYDMQEPYHYFRTHVIDRSISWAENNLFTHDLCQSQGLAGSDAAFNNQVPTTEIDIRKHICQLKSNSCLLIPIKPTTELQLLNASRLTGRF